MLKVQLLRSVSTQSLLLLPNPFLSGHWNEPFTIWPRHTLFEKQNYSTQPNPAPVDTKPVPDPTEVPFSRKSTFPPGFFFGTASSAYQSEGAAFKYGKGESNWDHFTHTCPEKIKDRSNGDSAVDAYHNYEDHVTTMKELGLNAYKFSIAWTRLFPNGKKSKGVNDQGIQFYKNLIKELKSKGIEPIVTLFHWDVPQALEDEYHGFLSDKIINDFKDYAEACYEAFGDEVKYWITLNEPWTFTTGGYVKGTFPPGKTDNAGADPYKVAHNLLLAHSVAVKIYRDKYQANQKGKIGITLNDICMVPYSDNPDDKLAAQRASDFILGWFMDPITKGEYPQSMQVQIAQRLPEFPKEEAEILKGSYDFLGLNYHTSNYAQAILSAGVPPPNGNPSYSTDSRCHLTTQRNGIHIGAQTASRWHFIYPKGLEDTLTYIKDRYKNPDIFVTGNGTTDDNNPMGEPLNDENRIDALRDHLKSLQSAMKANVNVKGFFLASLYDTFQWDSGYTARFGIYHVNFKDGLASCPKNSAHWLKKFLKD
ncbi:beta-glucosidase 12-like [Macadamia integrifolia]|uniref:beta-glucosidase 12-like n=1 Tax=Macadamia integrifolia TaxID=60698 RepID=UPI001C4EA5AB|nr:beta-glucosidase 12-like [Macadamia integrifolia]